MYGDEQALYHIVQYFLGDETPEKRPRFANTEYEENRKLETSNMYLLWPFMEVFAGGLESDENADGNKITTSEVTNVIRKLKVNKINAVVWQILDTRWKLPN